MEYSPLGRSQSDSAAITRTPKLEKLLIPSLQTSNTPLSSSIGFPNSPIATGSGSPYTENLLSTNSPPPPLWLRSNSANTALTTAEEEALEKEILLKEKQSLIHHEVPFVCSEVRNILEHSLEILNPNPYPTPFGSTGHYPASELKKGKLEDDKSVAPTDAQVVIFESSDGLVKGSCRVEGWNVTEAEIFLRSSKYNKSSVFKTTVSVGNPLKMSQIYDSYNLIKLSLRSLSELESFYSDSKKISYSQVSRSVEQISDSLRSALDELLFPSKELFPNYTPSNMAFQPPLPQEFVLYFSINNKELVISTYCIHPVTTTSLKTSVQQSHLSPLGQVFQYKRSGTKQLVEVLDYAQVNAGLNKLQSAYSQIERAYQLMAELKDKIILFP
eukprot:TRINITY_DN8490_c0_g1_i1.p1 TRINITY_DN8490_c0_g1~~TRINITY_DN8490_c0_g1_i1.p1  ORF type:complete len:393 (-),score=40.05 TRINITY_DN8490_c0_g1_i1:28-1185(-)